MPHSWLLLPAVVPVVTVLGIDNGIGLTPPRGWRSWNAFDCLEPRSILTQAHVKAQMDAVLDKSRLVDGKPTSLAELGFDWISMDDGWQRCNCSVRQDLDPKLPKCDGNLCFGGHCSWHDAAGVPVVRKDRFPNMKELVDYGHAHELKVGTYLNTCICNEHGSPHYSEDVKWMQEDRQLRQLQQCHPLGGAIQPDGQSNPRLGGDISADISSILNEAYATVDAADLPKPRSGPGCWAYPDMSEVGNFQSGPHREDQERTHWALWCIVSSPLILGFDMNDTATMDRVWPTITNRDALAISEAWVGNPGTLIRSYPSQHSERQLAQGRCDGSGQSVGFSFSGAKRGKLVAPKMAKGQEPLCVTTQSAPCPPPTTYAPDVRCGLMLRNCSTVKNQWIFADGRIQLDDQSQGKCLYSNRMDFDTTKGYFTRKAATDTLLTENAG
ncbi:unnamed protein product [Effrenium voratum]|nr:unnamed protein product [Effrenium voratum]